MIARSRIPQDVLLAAKWILPNAVFVETGTYQGDGAIFAARVFKRVITIEIDADLWTAAIRRLPVSVTALLGDSSQLLQRVLNEELSSTVVFWLDAHWSGGETGKGPFECPLLAELHCIVASAKQWIAIIDDARYFLSPPPQPHNAQHWPDIQAICSVLGSTAVLGIRDDVLVACSTTLANDMFSRLRVSTIKGWPNAASTT